MAISQATQFALVKQQLENVVTKLNAIESSLETKYVQATEMALLSIAIANLEKKMVTQDQFWPVKTLVYGAVAFGLIGILSTIGYVINLVTRMPI